MHIYRDLLIIFLSWTGYFFFRQNLVKTVSNAKAKSQLKKLTRFFGPKKDKTPTLCGYHTGSLLRPGQIAILDSKKCEICEAPAYARR